MPKQRERFASLILAVLLLLSLSAAPMNRAAAAMPWNGTDADISWYNPSSSAFTIQTPAQLAGLAKIVNDGTEGFAGKTVTLQADIDLGNHEWTPIGHSHVAMSGQVSNTFEGTFDGNGHTISNLKNEVHHTINDDPRYWFSFAGLFGLLDTTGVIKNLTVEGVVNVTRSNQSLPPAVTSFQGNAGGIVGYSAGRIENCVNRAAVRGEYASGGITGFLDSGSIVKCLNEGDVYHSDGVYAGAGGIVGFANATHVPITISQCGNTGRVLTDQATAMSKYLGGIAGCTSDGKVMIDNCFNAGEVSGMPQPTNTIGGGIVGGAYYETLISNCYNSGDITGGTNVSGAIAGELGSSSPPHSSIDNSYYLDSSHTKGVGKLETGSTDNSASKTDADMKSQAFLDLLNTHTVLWTFVPGIDYPSLIAFYSTDPGPDPNPGVASPSGGGQGASGGISLPSLTEGEARREDRIRLLPVPLGYDFTGVPVIRSATAEALGQGKAKLRVEAELPGSKLLYQWEVQNPDGSWRIIGGANSSVYTARGLKPGKEYSFRCQAQGYGGGQATSEHVSIVAE